MPIYEYRCSDCSLTFERLEIRATEIPTSQCPSCGGIGSKLISAPAIVYEYWDQQAYRLPDYDKKMAQAQRQDMRTLRTMPPLPGDKGKDVRVYEFDFDKTKRDKIEKLAALGETHG